MSAPSGPPIYKGEPLDAERGPGLGCFWIQVALLTFFLVFTPLTVTWGWDPFISGALLIFTLILLLFTGQTVIFLLRLVAADRRSRRAPLDPKARKTVGQMEDAAPTDDRAATEPDDLATTQPDDRATTEPDDRPATQPDGPELAKSPEPPGPEPAEPAEPPATGRTDRPASRRDDG